MENDSKLKDLIDEENKIDTEFQMKNMEELKPLSQNYMNSKTYQFPFSQEEQDHHFERIVKSTDGINDINHSKKRRRSKLF